MRMNVWTKVPKSKNQKDESTSRANAGTVSNHCSEKDFSLLVFICVFKIFILNYSPAWTILYKFCMFGRDFVYRYLLSVDCSRRYWIWKDFRLSDFSYNLLLSRGYDDRQTAFLACSCVDYSRLNFLSSVFPLSILDSELLKLHVHYGKHIRIFLL